MMTQKIILIVIVGCSLYNLVVLIGLMFSSRFARRRPKVVRMRLSFGAGKIVMNLKVSQELPINIQAEDEFGNATGAFDSAPQFSVADPSLATVKASDDGLSAVVIPTGKLGTTQVQVLAQADGKTIAGSLDLVLIPGDATQIVIQAGAPTDVPAPAAPVAADPVVPISS